jgi:hypothetical protein
VREIPAGTDARDAASGAADASTPHDDRARGKPMSEPVQQTDEVQRGLSARHAEVATAVVIFLLGALVVWDSNRLGSSWASDGPESGYFPFYIGLMLCVASAVIAIKAVVKHAMEGELFVTWDKLRLVMTVLVPAIVYVLAVQFLGIYLASAAYIAFFMIWLGRYPVLRSVIVGVAVNALFFMMFEVWFKVPLYKGALNPLGFLGY